MRFVFLAAFIVASFLVSGVAQAQESAPLYGVQVKEGRTTDEELKKISAAGLSLVRFVIPWAVVEKEQGRFDWGYFDQFITRLRSHGLGAVVVLGGGHPRYTGFMQAPAGNIDRTETYLLAPATEKARGAFAKFAAAAVAHFGGKDIVWELWNEPDIGRFWAPRANVADYIAWADTTCRSMRAVDPAVRIIAPGMADMPGRYNPDQAGFLGAVLRSSLMECLDGVSVHPYRDGEKPPETVLDAHQKLRAFIKRFAPQAQGDIPVYATEWGFTLTDTSEEDQAAFLLRSFMLNAMAGAPVSIWYEWRDARPGPDDPEAHFGLVKLNKAEKPSYRALAAFLPPLKGAAYSERMAIGQPEDYILLFRRADGNYSLVVWSSASKPATKIKVGDGAAVSLTFMPQRLDFGPTPPPVEALY